MLYRPRTSTFEKIRLLFKRRVQDSMLAYLGNHDGPGAVVEIPDLKGYVYCRFREGKDATGEAGFSAPFPVRSTSVPYISAPGMPVYIAYGRNNELQIVEGHHETLDRAGIDTRVLNPLNQQSQFVYLWQLTIGQAFAVSNSVVSSFLITIKKYRHYVNNRFQSFGTGDQDEKLDPEAYEPGIDEHRYVGVWTDTYLNEGELTVSDTQSLFTPLDETDVNETTRERPPDAIPHRLFYMANEQGKLIQKAAEDKDVRQFLNTPQIHGIPNPVAYRERIHPDRQVLFAGSMVVTGSLEVLGSLVAVESGGGSSGDITSAAGWQDDGTLVRLITPTDNVNIGGTTDLGKLAVVGDANEIQLRVRADAAQATDIMVIEDSAGVDYVQVGSDGRVGIGGSTHADAMLYLSGTARAARPFPSMTSGQIAPLSGSTPVGSLVYNSTISRLMFYVGVWRQLAMLPPAMTAKGDLFTYTTEEAALAVGANEHSLVADSAQTTGLKYAMRLARNYRAPQSLLIRKRTAAIIDVRPGMIEVAGVLVEKTTLTTLTMGTAGDWIGGSSLESASEYVWIYIDNAGNLKLYDIAPNYPQAATGSRVAEVRVNQAGWNGTAANGLNATSVVYDTDTGEGSIVAGMYALIYSDSNYTTGRGRGSAAAASQNDVSAALITAINTGTNTLTLEAGHQIAINDNDYIIVVQPGAILYRSVSAVWYRAVGRIFNDASSDLDDRRMMSLAYYNVDEGSNFATTSTSLTDIDTALLTLPVFVMGDAVECQIALSASSNGGNAYFVGLAVDGVDYAGDDGIQGAAYGAAILGMMGFAHIIPHLLPGTHYFAARYKTNANTITIQAGATATTEVHAQFNVKEVKNDF